MARRQLPQSVLLFSDAAWHHSDAQTRAASDDRHSLVVEAAHLLNLIVG
jgi:hypothetical protein